MRPIQLVILVVAVAAAGMAGMLAMNLANRPADTVVETVAAPPPFPTEEVLVTTQDIRIGTAITPELMAWRVWPAEGLGDGFILRTQRPEAIDELQGTLARGPFLSGEPVKEAKLVRSDRGFLSAVLPKGMRAVAVRVNAASTAGGFILPEDRVDVILTQQPSGGTAQSETILTNIRVLAIDQTVEQAAGESQTAMVAQDTATLELTPEQAELITQAQQIGSISLALRSLEDAAVDASQQRKPTGVTVVKFGVQSRITARPSE